ncbi:MAG: hypothetical protein KDC90_13045 [Ignavibacteriae bacterium]|nr:hypothetical protein [Ignavibacteriota bacterium]
MKDASPLLLLKKIQQDTITQAELKTIIEFCFNTSASILHNYYKTKIDKKNYSKEFVDDLAIDAIVPLFIKNKSGVLGIKRAMDNWSDQIADDADAEFFISRLIWKRTDQAITNMLKEQDPIFNKILKTLNICITTSNIKKIRYLGTVYVVENQTEVLDGNLIKNENFKNIPNDLFGYKQVILFEKLFDYLKRETHFTPAIPLNLMIKRVKEYYIQKHFHSKSVHAEQDNIFLYDDIVQIGLNSIKEQLDTYYVPNYRLNENDAELIMSSFKNISEDLLNGGMNGSLYDYLKSQNVSLSSEKFYSDYHSIMNYLFNNFKKQIANLVE